MIKRLVKSYFVHKQQFLEIMPCWVLYYVFFGSALGWSIYGHKELQEVKKASTPNFTAMSRIHPANNVSSMN